MSDQSCLGDTAHQYEPRYDLILPDKRDTFWETTLGVTETLKNKIYVMDICTRCGNQVKR